MRDYSSSDFGDRTGTWDDTGFERERRSFDDFYRDISDDPGSIIEQLKKRLGFESTTGSSPVEELHPEDSRMEAIHAPGANFLFFGVLLPLAAILAETQTHLLARSLFDPFPSFSHVLLFLLIPLSNFLAWLAVRANISTLYSLAALGSGMSLGVCILYSLMLLPAVPNLILAMPFGLLGIAPMAAIPCTLHAGRILCLLSQRQMSFFDAHQVKHIGHIIILVMVVAVELPSTLTRINLAKATMTETRQEGIDWLRSWGSTEVLLRACYERSGRATDILGSLYEHQHPVKVEEARRIYYAVTGVPFNSVPIPQSFRATISNVGLIDDPDRLNAGAVDEFDLDPDIAGEMVAGVARGLSASKSIIEGQLDGDAAIASLDWSFTFTNVSHVPREARAQITLPPGAVVTRATMWLNGVEKEATIMSRGLARRTYQRAVKEHKKDPLLVSMTANDTVLVQCYPVARGNTTRVRLHIVAPMVVDNDNRGEAVLSLPTFKERNFAFAEPIDVVLSPVGESRTGVTMDNTTLEQETADKFTGKLDNKLLARYNAAVRVKRDASVTSASLKDGSDPLMSSRNTVQERLQKPASLIVVVDKSVTMRPYIGDIVKGLGSLPRGMPVVIVEVKDGTRVLFRGKAQDGDKFREALAKLETNGCAGGQINSYTVFRSTYDPGQLGLNSDSRVLWIHAAQPVAAERDILGTKTALKRRGKQSGDAQILDMQVASGPNNMFDGIVYSPYLARIERTGTVATDLSRLFASWGTKSEAVGVKPGKSATTGLELDRLRAYDRVLSLYGRGDRFGAYAWANKYHLITPVSSAVVSDENLVQKFARLSESIRAKKKVSSKSPVRKPASLFGGTGNRPSSAEEAGVDTAARMALKRSVDQLNSLSVAAGSADQTRLEAKRSGARADYFSSAGEDREEAGLKSNKHAFEKHAKLKARESRRRHSLVFKETEKSKDGRAFGNGYDIKGQQSAGIGGARGPADNNVYPGSAEVLRSPKPVSGAEGRIATSTEEAIGDRPMDPQSRSGESDANINANEWRANREIQGKALRLQGMPDQDKSGAHRKREHGAFDQMPSSDEKKRDTSSAFSDSFSSQPQGDYGRSKQLQASNAPLLQGATNGTIGPQGDDATAIMGVNTGGTTRVSNLANADSLRSLLVYLAAILLGIIGLATMKAAANKQEKEDDSD